LALAFAAVLPLIDQEKVVELIFYEGLAKTLAFDPISNFRDGYPFKHKDERGRT